MVGRVLIAAVIFSCVAPIATAGKRLNNLVTELLDVEGAAAGAYEFQVEAYNHEQPTEDEARTYLERRLSGTMRQFKEIRADAHRRVIVTLGIFSAAPEILNIDPQVDYHFKLFRPDATTAELTISDWKSPTERRGVGGYLTAFNFVEVAPYLED